MKALLSAAALAALLLGWLLVTPPPPPAPRPDPDTTASLGAATSSTVASAPAEPGEVSRAIRIVYPAPYESGP